MFICVVLSYFDILADTFTLVKIGGGITLVTMLIKCSLRTASSVAGLPRHPSPSISNTVLYDDCALSGTYTCIDNVLCKVLLSPLVRESCTRWHKYDCISTAHSIDI